MKIKTGQRRLDANESPLFLRAAEYVMGQTYDVVYAQYTAMQYIPVSHEGGAADTIIYRQFDEVSVAKIINNYATDFPRVDVKGKEFRQAVKDVGNSYGWNVMEIRRALYEGLPLDAMRAKVAREAHVRLWNRIAWKGDTEAGLQGILYHPNVTKAAAVTGSWSAGVTANDLILKDVNTAIQGPYILTKGVEQVDTCLLPLDKYSLLATTPYSAQVPTFLLEILQKGNPGVLFAPVLEMGALPTNPRTGATASTNVILTFRRDQSKVWLAIPQDFEQMEPDKEGMEYVIACHSRIAGIITPYPLSIRVTDGI